MKNCILRIKDQVNIKFENVDPGVRRQMVDVCKYPIPSARHSQAFKMGRWDGCKNFCSTSGASFLNMLDKLVPILEANHYEIEVIDERTPFEIELPNVSETMLAHKVWPEGHPIAGEQIVLRDYQVEAIQRYFENQQSIQQISTGAGKCCSYDTLIEIDFDENSPFGQVMVNIE